MVSHFHKQMEAIMCSIIKIYIIIFMAQPAILIKVFHEAIQISKLTSLTIYHTMQNTKLVLYFYLI